MKQKLKLIILAFVALTGVLLLFHSDSVSATGEKWELIDNTTIRVSGGAFTGPVITSIGGKTVNIGNPASIDLKPRDGSGQTDPSIWIATKEFALIDIKTNKGFEDSHNGSLARLQGEFCIEILSFPNLINHRTDAAIKAIHREDCNKAATDIRWVNPGPVTGEYMRCGLINWDAWKCNTLWSTTTGNALSGNPKLKYAIPGDPLKCGDPGYVSQPGENCVFNPALRVGRIVSPAMPRVVSITASVVHSSAKGTSRGVWQQTRKRHRPPRVLFKTGLAG